MQYAEFGKSGVRVSRLGFGCMRFPKCERKGIMVWDHDESVRLLHHAMDIGINYLDTAPLYCDTESEIIVGKALKGRRNSVYVSTKNNIKTSSGDDFERMFETSMKKLDIDYIDFYHFWGISLDVFRENAAPKGPLDRAVRLKKEGVIRHISFSFHDSPGNMSQIIREGKGIFETVLCQYNLLDQSLTGDIAFAREQGLGVVIMGPVGGGRLGAPSPVIQSLLPGKVASSAELALRFVLTNPNVTMALSGMGSIKMVDENAAVADNPARLTETELARINEMMRENARLADLYCTGCNYCMPCPGGLHIPEIFRLMNYHRVYKLTGYAREQYALIGHSEERKYKDAAACIDCGLCEKKCPQRLKIREQLRQTHAELAPV
ncbi:MAG: aldo/keto reductase [Treponema sp.]|jgi:predicted aldo/keto reductase-like oxidoreductase|nr:aldo/keto reductase [Treponema sp.]